MKLIKELTEDVEYITESKDEGGKNYFIEGIIMQGDIKNRNGRVYPKEVLMREMKRYNKTYVEDKRAYGELGHPEGPNINLDRVCIMFENLREDGCNVVGRAKVMSTPMGQIVRNFIDDGAKLGISSRGLGSVKMNKSGVMEVQEDFMLATAGDIVADPSAPNAFVQGIMENTEFYFDVGTGHWEVMDQSRVTQVIEETVEEVKQNYTKLTEADKFRMFERYLNTLKG